MPALHPPHRISVIIPTYNKAHLLDLTLASYLHQTYRPFELVITDDGSTDDTRAVVERYRRTLDLRYIHQPNRGRAAARNAALREATGDLLVFSDDDRLAAPGFLAAHAREFSSAQDNTLVLGWQDAILTWWEQSPNFWEWVRPLLDRRPELKPVLTGQERLQLVSASDVREQFAEVIAKFGLEEAWWSVPTSIFNECGGDPNTFHLAWAFCTTGNMSVSRQRLLDVGLFDESFSGWGIEDTELCFRLSQAGARITLSREAINHHQLHPRSPQFPLEWIRNFNHFSSKYDDSLQIPLFFLLVNKNLSSQQVQAILSECAALEREGRLTLVNELKRLYRLSVQATLAEIAAIMAGKPPAN